MPCTGLWRLLIVSSEQYIYIYIYIYIYYLCGMRVSAHRDRRHWYLFPPNSFVVADPFLCLVVHMEHVQQRGYLVYPNLVFH